LALGFGSHRSVNVRRAVAQSVSNELSEDLYEVFGGLLTDRDAEVRDWVAFQMGYLTVVSRERILESLMGAMSDSDRGVRLSSVRSYVSQLEDAGLQSIGSLLAECGLSREALDGVVDSMTSPLDSLKIDYGLRDTIRELIEKVIIGESK